MADRPSADARRSERVEGPRARRGKLDAVAGRTPRTEYRLTAEGRAALESYLGHMEALIDATRETAPEVSSKEKASRPR